MDETFIDTRQLARAFKYGFNQILANREHLNQINVFPVADRDTGINLALSFKDAVCDEASYASIKAYLNAVSLSIFYNARGNSGMLYAIWFEGLSRNASENDLINFCELFQLFKLASDFLHREMRDIASGTLPTMQKDFFSQISPPASVDESNVETIRAALQTCLEKTQIENECLSESALVDAGALSFCLFLEGLIDSLLGNELCEKMHDDAKIYSANTHAHTMTAPPEHRYCTEAILKLVDAKFDAVQSLIRSSGDCDQLLSKEGLLRFHVHTPKPQKLFAELSQHATVTNPKVEDMLRQFETHHDHPHIALVTDSSLDLSQEILDKYQIHRIPVTLLQGENEWVDSLGIDSDWFYQNLNEFKPYPTTATPTLGKIKLYLDDLSNNCDHILVITVASKLSGTYAAFEQASRENSKVHLIDSRKNSGAHGLLVEKAGQLIKENASIDKVISQIEATRQHTHIYVAVDNFSSMLRSGRVSPIKGFMGKMLNLKPIVSLANDGRGIVYSKHYSRERSLEKLMALTLERHHEKPLEAYALMHVDAIEVAQKLAKRLSQSMGAPPLFIKPVSPVIGLHAGPGAVAVALRQEYI